MERGDVPGSSRVTIGGCRWFFVSEFKTDLKALQLTADDLATLKRLLQRAAQGTVRFDEWEYPLALGGGVIGELRMDIEELKYRIFYYEPTRDMTALLALGIMVKSHDDEGQWKGAQNAEIERARARLIDEGCRWL